MNYYQFQGSKTLLVLFHGTGGDEHDLVPLAKQIDPQASILSLRGEVSENGMNRFFKRTSFGVFDLENVKEEAKKIHTFLQEKTKEYERIIYIGYSNGANMIGAMMQLFGNTIPYAILLHPMQVLPDSKPIQSSVCITYGTQDTMITPEQTKKFIEFLEQQGAAVTTLSFAHGHQISVQEIDSVKRWYESL
ncbi:MAG: alpha/beta hydrolase [Candidatus Woesearchaeota archaeon]